MSLVLSNLGVDIWKQHEATYQISFIGKLDQIKRRGIEATIKMDGDFQPKTSSTCFMSENLKLAGFQLDIIGVLLRLPAVTRGPRISAMDNKKTPVRVARPECVQYGPFDFGYSTIVPLTTPPLNQLLPIEVLEGLQVSGKDWAK